MTNAILVICAVLVGVVRFAVPGHAVSPAGSYEAFAHLLCGVLIACGCNGNKLAWWLLGIITVLEAVMFFAGPLFFFGAAIWIAAFVLALLLGLWAFNVLRL